MKKILLSLHIIALLLLQSCNEKTNIVTLNGQEFELEDGMYAKITTNKGDIMLQLEYEKAPMTVASFVGLAEGTIENSAVEAGTPYFDGLKFHRVVPDFVIQGGDPDGTGQGGPGYQFPQEIHPDLKHDKAGTLAMANAGPNTNGSQFYITHKATPNLDGHYNVFGYTIQNDISMETVNSIAANDIMQKIEIIRVGTDAGSFDASEVFNIKQEDIKVEMERQAAIEDSLSVIRQIKARELMAERLAQVDDLIAKAKNGKDGLKYIITKDANAPKITNGDVAQIHYVLYAKEDGRMIDVSVESIAKDNGIYDKRRPYQPLQVGIGNGEVIKGWDQGLTYFGKGDKGILIVPPSLGYGENGVPGMIPPNTTLIFEIEIMDVAR